jgi:hypothetical protein
VSQSFEGHLLGPHLNVWLDPSGTKSIDDLPDEDFRPAQTNIPNHGFTKANLWVSFEQNACAISLASAGSQASLDV